MTPRVSIAWHRVVKWGVRLATAAGLVVGFLTLSPLIAGPIGVALLALNVALERVRFYARVLHVMPLPSEYAMDNKLGSLWAVEDYRREQTLVFGQVFRTERAAREGYQLFRAWNFGDYIDRNGNIILSIVREELDRFTFLLFPGERGVAHHAVSMIAEKYGQDVDAVVSRLLFFFATYADYWKRPNMKAIIEELATSPRVLLNCYFLLDGELQPVAKRYLELSMIVLVERSKVTPGSLESCVLWEGPWAGMDAETREKYEPLFQRVNDRGNIVNPI